MNKSVLFGALAIAGVAAGAAAAGTLDDVKARGKLNCGVTALRHPMRLVNGKALTLHSAAPLPLPFSVMRQPSNSSQQLARHALPRWLLAKSICWHVTPHGHFHATSTSSSISLA